METTIRFDDFFDEKILHFAKMELINGNSIRVIFFTGEFEILKNIDDYNPFLKKRNLI